MRLAPTACLHASTSDAKIPELHVHRILTPAPDDGGSGILLKADGLDEDPRTPFEIAVTTELVPTMALALLATTAQARALRDEFDPALDVMAAAVVRSSSGTRVRLRVFFGEGAVLPLELTLDAGRALNDGLTEYRGSSRRRLARRAGSAGDQQPSKASKSSE